MEENDVVKGVLKKTRVQYVEAIATLKAIQGTSEAKASLVP